MHVIDRLSQRINIQTSCRNPMYKINKDMLRA